MPRLFAADALLEIGFRDVGEWFWAEGRRGLEYRLDGAHAAAHRPLLDEAPALYAFVQGERVVYIGKTARTLRDRLSGYRNPGRTQRTNWRCNEKIREEVAAGRPVRIFVFCPSPQVALLRFGEFAIDLPAGLENALIEAFEPPWNGGERGAAVTETAEREEGEASPPTDGPVEATPAQATGAPAGLADFTIKLGTAYYDLGIINPGVEASRHLGEHEDPITVFLGSMDRPAVCRIDRRANSSGSVRVLGDQKAIRGWIQAHFGRGETINARVLDRNSILLMPKR